MPCQFRKGRLCRVRRRCWEDAMSVTTINDADRLACSSSSIIHQSVGTISCSANRGARSFYRRRQSDSKGPFEARDLMHWQQTRRLAKWRSARSSSGLSFFLLSRSSHSLLLIRHSCFAPCCHLSISVPFRWSIRDR